MQDSASVVVVDWAVLAGVTALLLVVVSRNARWKEA
jgi:hypothetical protein